MTDHRQSWRRVLCAPRAVSILWWHAQHRMLCIKSAFGSRVAISSRQQWDGSILIPLHSAPFESANNTCPPFGIFHCVLAPPRPVSLCLPQSISIRLARIKSSRTTSSRASSWARVKLTNRQDSKQHSRCLVVLRMTSQPAAAAARDCRLNFHTN